MQYSCNCYVHMHFHTLTMAEVIKPHISLEDWVRKRIQSVFGLEKEVGALTPCQNNWKNGKQK